MNLTGRVGQGGSTELLRGRLAGPANFTKPVLVKRLRAAASRDPRQVDRLKTEALLTARVSHPNVLTVMDMTVLDGDLLVLHDDAKVTDLLRILEIFATQRKRLPPRVVLGIGWLIADALAVAHATTDAEIGLAGIAHGDLSPSNVLVTDKGRVLLVDFGIPLQAATTPGQLPVNKLGRLHGKPGYMSPELVVRGVIGPKSDLFALGTLLWEMLTLRRLFVGKDAPETLKNVALANVDERFARHADIPPFVKDVLRKALARQPDDRFASAREMQDSLVSCHPQGFFGIEQELADLMERFAPVPNDEPLELESSKVSRVRRGVRVAPRMILHVPGVPEAEIQVPLGSEVTQTLSIDLAAAIDAAEAPGAEWIEVEPDAPEILSILEGLATVPPLELEPPPLPPPSAAPIASGGPPPLPPPSARRASAIDLPLIKPDDKG